MTIVVTHKHYLLGPLGNSTRRAHRARVFGENSTETCQIVEFSDCIADRSVTLVRRSDSERLSSTPEALAKVGQLGLFQQGVAVTPNW